METNSNYCKVCMIYTNSADQYSMHLLGKAHARKVAKAAQPPTVTSSAETGNVTSSADTVAVATTETETVSTEQPKAPSESTESSAPVTEEDNGSTSGEKKKVKKEVKEKKNEESFCAVCVVRLSSKSQADMHFNGSKHKKMVNLRTGKLNTGVKRKQEEFCDICNIILSSPLIADAHYAGSKHERKSKLANTLGKTDGTGLPVTQQPGGYQYQFAQASADGAPPEVQSAQPTTQLFKCYTCGVSVNSDAQLQAHLKGSKHRNKVLGIEPQPKKKFKPNPPSKPAVQNTAVTANPTGFYADYQTQNASYSQGTDDYSQNASYGQNINYGQNASFGQTSSYGQPANFGQNPSYGQTANFGQNSNYGQKNSFGQDSNYGQSTNYYRRFPGLSSSFIMGSQAEDDNAAVSTNVEQPAPIYNYSMGY
ncbi:zinc finger matrin-type protein 1-like isoform X2 [Physella acuta]|uniref:zinc finger matrin-type protein 1-like isoform X2 n=1 Tax=Physella acuta TaxID=109671 RepID=UPI0027DE1CB6|nr:zinc finger matrin-type protein 1-like isoform X2 [Physella acuta]